MTGLPLLTHSHLHPVLALALRADGTHSLEDLPLALGQTDVVAPLATDVPEVRLLLLEHEEHDGDDDDDHNDDQQGQIFHFRPPSSGWERCLSWVPTLGAGTNIIVSRL